MSWEQLKERRAVHTHAHKNKTVQTKSKISSFIASILIHHTYLRQVLCTTHMHASANEWFGNMKENKSTECSRRQAWIKFSSRSFAGRWEYNTLPSVNRTSVRSADRGIARMEPMAKQLKHTVAIEAGLHFPLRVAFLLPIDRPGLNRCRFGIESFNARDVC